MKLTNSITTCLVALAALSLATAASAQINQPPVITSAGGGASAELSAAAPLILLPGNPTALPPLPQDHYYLIHPISALTAIDVDQDVVSFSVGGVDAANFATLTGVPGLSGLVLAWVLDFDSQGTPTNFDDDTTSFVPDANGDGVFEVTVQASDGRGGSDTQALSIHFPFVPNQPAVRMVKGADVPGGGTLVGFGSPQAGAFAGTVKLGTKKVSAIFAPDGKVLLQVGVNDVAKLGALSGDAALVTLKTGGAVTAKNSVRLMTGLSTGTPVVAAKTGTTYGGLPQGVTIKKFVSIDGHGSATFALVNLDGTANKVALCAVRGVGDVNIVASQGQEVTLGGMKVVKTLATLVGTKGTLAANRWRLDDATFGIRVTFADKGQAIFAVPAGAATAADWVLKAQTGLITSGPLVGVAATSFGLPGFGSTSSAQVANLAKADGLVTAVDNAAVMSGSAVLARKGKLAPDKAGTAMTGVIFKALADPLSGAGGAVAFAGTLSGTGVGGTNKDGLWYAADGATAKLLARTGTDADAAAPGGGHWKSFGTMVLPDSATLGPIFLGTLATSAADSVDKSNNFGLWAVDRTGTLRLLFRTGQNPLVNVASKQVKTFTALVSSVGSIGAANGYDNAGKVAVLATFNDGTQALLVVTVP